MSFSPKNLWSDLAGLVTGGKSEPLSLARAFEIFDQLAKREDMDFNHARGGCHIEAELMCRAVREMKLKPFKAWAFAYCDANENENYGKVIEKLLMPFSTDGQENERKWWFHVALALPVKMPDGKVVKMVFDPGLFDGPVTEKDWGKAMGARDYLVQVQPYNRAPTIGLVVGGSYIPGDVRKNIQLAKLRGEMEELKKIDVPPYPRLRSPYRALVSAQTTQGQKLAPV